MPTLLEIERAVYRSLVEHDDATAAQHILADGLAPEARLNVYRNTFIGTLTTALRLSFPAVHRLVGAEFFENAARIFIEEAPPRSAYLDEYGAAFPEFLQNFAAAASLAYLSGVARLEWAVSRAFRAPYVQPLDIARLSAIDQRDHGRVVFMPHPSVGLVEADHPVDEIWRAVLAQDDAAMTAIDLAAGPVRLLVQRLEAGVDVRRIGEPAWHFMAALCVGRPLQDAMDAAPDVDVAIALGVHLAAGRFVGFELVAQGNAAHPQEGSP
jgi:putative DNA-binding protein